MLLVHLLFSGNSEAGGKAPDRSNTIALQSPLSEYNGRFEIGLGQSMVRFSFFLLYVYVQRKKHLTIRLDHSNSLSENLFNVRFLTSV
jgi:hypothetical protein